MHRLLITYDPLPTDYHFYHYYTNNHITIIQWLV